MRCVAVVIGSRANYASIKSALSAIDAHSHLDLQLVLAASAVLDRYGDLSDIIVKDGFTPDQTIHFLVEGETPATMAKSTGLGIIELASTFERMQPDIVLTVGDRFETMATTLAAAYMNYPIAHTMGGEVSGNIDESIRHAVTKFAHVHFPATALAYERIVRLGELPESVHLVGCPRIDLAADVLTTRDHFDLNGVMSEGVGDAFSLEEPFILLTQHPVTSEYGAGEHQITESLVALESIGVPVLVLWPNADAGSEEISRGIRKWRERKSKPRARFIKNMPAETYLHVLASTSCVVGNSSSGIREGAFIGTPCVNVGTRQQGRERGENVVDVPHDRQLITEAVRQQLNHGRFDASHIYGDGNAGYRIAQILADIKEVPTQKRLAY